MIEDFTADDARSMFKDETDEQTNKILENIKQIAHKEKIYHWYGAMSPVVKSNLEDKKFTVKLESHRDESRYEISW
jgi:hypothetical protein